MCFIDLFCCRNLFVLGDMLRIKNLQRYSFDDEDSWGKILSSVAWAVRNIPYHTTSPSGTIDPWAGHAVGY